MPFDISCQNHRSKHLNSHYIYRICYKNAKKGKPSKKVYPIEKTISQVLNPPLGCWIHSRYLERLDQLHEKPTKAFLIGTNSRRLFMSACILLLKHYSKDVQRLAGLDYSSLNLRKNLSQSLESILALFLFRLRRGYMRAHTDYHLL